MEPHTLPDVRLLPKKRQTPHAQYVAQALSQGSTPSLSSSTRYAIVSCSTVKPEEMEQRRVQWCPGCDQLTSRIPRMAAVTSHPRRTCLLSCKSAQSKDTEHLPAWTCGQSQSSGEAEFSQTMPLNSFLHEQDSLINQTSKARAEIRSLFESGGWEMPLEQCAEITLQFDGSIICASHTTVTNTAGPQRSSDSPRLRRLWKTRTGISSWKSAQRPQRKEIHNANTAEKNRKRLASF